MILDQLVAEKGFNYRYPSSREVYINLDWTPASPTADPYSFTQIIDPKLRAEEDRNPDFMPGCHYVDMSGDEAGEPIYTYSCIIGGVINKLAPEMLEEIWAKENDTSAECVVHFLPPRFHAVRIREILGDLQLRQDQSWPWGIAARIAKHELAQLD